MESTVKEAIAQNNKIIDEFVGSKGEWHSNKDRWGAEVWGEYKPNKYHSNWNLLMEVVEKIESLGFDFAIYTGSSASIISTNEFPLKEIVSEGNKTKIEAVYNACLEFIKWYNEQKSA